MKSEEFTIKTDPRARGRYTVMVKINNREMHLGSFEDFDKALKACVESKRILEGE